MLSRLFAFSFIIWSCGFTLHAFGAQSVEGAPIEAALVHASNEYGLPLCLLRAVAQVESSLTHRVDSPADTADLDAPRSYGVMGLRDDPYFGHSLESAAQLLEVNKEELMLDYQKNILGASAYLKKIALATDALGGSAQLGGNCADISRWKKALIQYSGIPSKESSVYFDQVALAASQFSAHFGTVSLQKTAPQVNWDPSPNFGGTLHPRYIVIHTTEGNYAAALAWFKNPDSHVSSHFLIRSSDGAITQLVSEENVAWHARCWNDYAIGIEHEAYSTNGAGLTSALYRSSAGLVKYLAQEFGIPIDPNHIIGHDFWQTQEFMQSPLGDCQTHNDPGRFWNWNLYFSFLMGRQI